MRVLRGALLFFAILIPLVIVAGFLLLRSSLPAREGAIRLTGLSGSVDVLYDAFGVPHIYASNEKDLFMAEGFLHAQERMWQMDLMRRAANGRLSEIFGEKTVKIDRYFKMLGLWHAADSDIIKLDPDVRLLLDAYVSGINDYIRTTRTFRSPEFLILRYRPEPWTVSDSISIMKLVAFTLSANMESELLRGKLIRKFGPERTEEIFGVYPADGMSIIEPGDLQTPQQKPKRLKAPPNVHNVVDLADFETPEFPPELAFLEPHEKPESNSFVIDGKRSATGKPLLENDPHLHVQMPGMWYETHLSAGSMDVAGVTIPGLPFIIIGHNRQISWGVTNLYADTQDLYIEDIDAKNRNRYRLGDQWYDMHVDKLLVYVRGGDPARVRSRWTIHGPVITQDVTGFPATVSLAWTGYFGGRSTRAFYEINRAADFTAFQNAVAEFDAPSQNFIYADTSGNIGYAASGSVPMRRYHSGLSPVVGSEPRFQWAEFIDRKSRPFLYNPRKGYVITANDRVIDDPHFRFSLEYGGTFRAARIEHLLLTKEKYDRADLQAIQADVFSQESELYRPHWEALKARADGSERKALDLLLGWKGTLDGSPAAMLFEAFRVRLAENALKDDMGDLYEEFLKCQGERVVGALALLDRPDSKWWDDTRTPQIERMDDIIARSLVESYDALRSKLGDTARWRWPAEHRLTLAHVLGFAKPLSSFFNRGPFERPGDGETVNKADYSFESPYGVTATASWRVIMDASNWDASVSIMPSGQSGHPLSTNYSDQAEMFLRGDCKPMPFSKVAVEKAARSRLQFAR